MKYLNIFLMAFIIFSFFGPIRSDFTQGGFLHLFVNIFNDQNQDRNDVTVKAYLYDLGEYSSSGHVDIDSGDHSTVSLRYDLTDVEPDYYPVAVSAGNDDFREKTHRWVWIG